MTRGDCSAQDVDRLPVRILVRTRVDWRSMDRTAFLAQSDPARPAAFVSAAPLDLWEAAYGSSFFTYRAQLQEVAFSSFEAAGADALSVGFHGMEGWWDDPQDEIIVPFDDDDLLIGPLAGLSSAFGDDVDVVLWPGSMLSLGEDGRMAWRVRTVKCILATNCALRKSFLRRHFSRSEIAGILSDHVRTNEGVGEVLAIDHDDTVLPGIRRLDHPSVALSSRCYSLKNGHVGSIQLLVKATRREDPVGHLRGLTLEVERPIPAYAAALRPQIEELEEIWRSLRHDGSAPALST